MPDGRQGEATRDGASQPGGGRDLRLRVEANTYKRSMVCRSVAAWF